MVSNQPPPIYSIAKRSLICHKTKYLRRISKPKNEIGAKQFAIRLVLTALVSVIFFIAFGPDEARINNKLIIRKNNTQLQDDYIVYRHLQSPI